MTGHTSGMSTYDSHLAPMYDTTHIWNVYLRFTSRSDVAFKTLAAEDLSRLGVNLARRRKTEILGKK